MLRDSLADVIPLSDRRVRVRTSPEVEAPMTADRIDANGLVLCDTHSVIVGRYVWLEMELPGDEPVTALGEVLPRSHPGSIALDIRFKHLFPDHKRRLLRALSQTLSR